MSESVVLVTGATGFIGSHLVRRLLASRKRVIGSNVSGSSGRLEDVRDQVEIVRADIGARDFYLVTDIFQMPGPTGDVATDHLLPAPQQPADKV